MAAPTIFRSTDGGAPALNGNAGSLVNVLDWCLDTGTNAGALGWTIAFTAANKRSYRAPAGVQHYIDIDDNAPDGTALGRNARGRGYEAMTAIGTGTGPFPTAAQAATSVLCVKSTATGTTARPWLVIGDDRTFLMFIESAGTDPPVLGSHTWTTACYFGEILSALTGDLYRSILGWQSTTSTVVTAGLNCYAAALYASSSVIQQNLPRAYTGAGGSLWGSLLGPAQFNAAVSSYQVDAGFLAFPNNVDGGLYCQAVDVLERGTAATPAGTPTGIRGRLRGVYGTVFNTSGYNDQDTFTGIGDFAGKTFIALKTANGMLAVETTAWAYSS